MRLHAPPDDLAAIQVENNRQIQPTLFGLDIGDVASPHRIRLHWLEVAIEQVRHNRQVMLVVRGGNKFTFPPRFDAVPLHEPLDTFFTYLDAVCPQLFPDSRPAVFAFAARMGCLDMNQQRFIAGALAGVRWRGSIFAALMLKISAGTDTQHFTLHGDRPLLLVTPNPGVLHADSRAKNAVAFFKMSRSILTRASSALNCANSICSALTGLAPAPVSLPFAASLTQLSSVCLGMPNTFKMQIS